MAQVAVGKTVLKIRNLWVDFPRMGGQTSVVRQCSLDVKEGEIVGLVGESGSGKSMAAMSCLGLTPKPSTTRGNITVAGREVIGMPERELNRLRGGIAAIIFQNPMTALNPFISIGEQFNDAIRSNLSVSSHAAERAAIAVLNAVYLSNPAETLKKYPHQLSGGQLQRIMIAMVIACKPKLLIADEPTTALDVTIQAQILLLIREITTANRLAVLFITHDLSVVATVCDRVAVMYAGEIVEFGRVADIFRQPRHPYTQSLLQTVPVLGIKDKQLKFIPGQVPDMARLPSGCAFQSRCEFAMPHCLDVPPRATVFRNMHRASCHLLNHKTPTHP